MNLLEIEGLNKHFDGVHALADFSCSVRSGEILGLIGPNGAGKTTFFNVITGFLQAEQGNACFKGCELLGRSPYKIARLGIGRTFQNLRLIRQMSVFENLLLSYKDQPGERLGGVFFRPRACRVREEENRQVAFELLDYIGLRPKADDAAGALSYGQQKLLSLTCCLAAGAELLLLDEPVAGIAPEMIDKVLSVILDLPAQGKSVVIIEHNIDAIMRVCDRVIFMDAGAKLSEGTPDQVRNDPKVIEAYID
jgi:ABC-type branched-subunit amino acid transport system ATPase component